MAQVYSVNAVGYVNTPIPGNNQLAILANPLIGTNNSINTVIPTAPDGMIIYRFDPATQNYRDSIAYIDGVGWLSTDPDHQLPVREGFWVQNSAPATTLTFVGEVAQGAASNGVQLQGANNLSLVASKVPQSARLGETGAAGTWNSLQPTVTRSINSTWRPRTTKTPTRSSVVSAGCIRPILIRLVRWSTSAPASGCSAPLRQACGTATSA
jgi:hypothetical protein